MPQPVPPAVESLAQRYTARVVSAKISVYDNKNNEESDSFGSTDACDYQEVDVASLELVRPRSVGVEHVGLAALSWLGLPEILEGVGFNGIQRNRALSSIVGRMACPAGSELSSLRWLQERSALGQLLDMDFEGVSLMRLYRVSDLLVSRRDEIERRLFSRISDLFSLPATVTFYDLTNTYFEGEMAANGKAKHGHSKEKRGDCPLVTLGVALDGSGFVRRSRMFGDEPNKSRSVVDALERDLLVNHDAFGFPAAALLQILDQGVVLKPGNEVLWATARISLFVLVFWRTRYSTSSSPSLFFYVSTMGQQCVSGNCFSIRFT